MKTVGLSTVATIERKGVDPGAIPPETPYLGLEHIERGGRIIGRASVGDAELASTKFQFTPEHVLYGKLRPNLGKISRPDFSGVCSTDILPIRAGRDLDRDYLAHYLAQPSMVAFAASRTSGANLPRLSPAVLAKFPIPLPPLPEQRRIAAILDHADALRAKRRQVLAHLDPLIQAVFNDMFGGEPWERRCLGEVTECLDARRIPVKASDRRAGDVPYYGANGIQGWIDRPIFDEPLVLVAEDGGHFDDPSRGVAYRIDGPAWVNNHAHVLRAGPLLDTEYLHRAVRHYDFTPYISGSTRSKLNQKQLKAASIPVPPLDVQQAFAGRVAKIERQRLMYSAALTCEEKLFASLQLRAFRGEL